MDKNRNINILIASAGTRNKVVQAFRETLSGRGHVIATDASPYAPAIYDADRAYIVPRITAPDYIDRLLEICRKEEITGIFSLIDPELSLLARNRERFLEQGVTPIVSGEVLCELCLDKFAMYRYLMARGIRTAACWNTLRGFEAAREAKEVCFPVFVKPQRGSASIGISRVENDETIRLLFANYGEWRGPVPADTGLRGGGADGPEEDSCGIQPAAFLTAQPAADNIMVQELMRGQEYGCDAYVDLISGKCTGLFLKKKLRMRAGETDKSVSVKEPGILAWLADFAESTGFRGMIDMDLFHDEHGQENDSAVIPEGEWYLSEVNPRFGGGYPHACACGVNFAEMVIENLEGRENPVRTGQYESGIVMMKYSELSVLGEEKLIK